MRFVDHVRRNRVPTPPQQRFDPAHWRANFERLDDGSPEDRALFDAGLWFAERLANARAAWRELPRLDHAPVDLARALVGAVNFQTARSARLVAAGIADAPIAERQSQLEELTEKVQHMVSSLKVPLANALQSIEPEGAPDTSEAYALVNGVRRRLYLGQQYTGLLHLWNQCVGHGWYVQRMEAVDVVTPADEQRERWFAAAHFRRDTIGNVMAANLSMEWAKMNPRRRLEIADVPVVQAVTRHAKRLRMRLGPVDVHSSHPPFSWIARVMAREQYLEDIIDEPLPRFDGLSTRDLLNVLWILSPLAELLTAEIPESQELSDLHDLHGFAPRLHRDDLVKAVRVALGLDRARATRAIDIVTFDGSFRDDLWHKPLIPLDGPWLTIVFEALRTPNLLWLVDRWLRDGEFDMASRGGIFEARLREALGDACLLDNAAVLPHALKLPLEDGTEEDIDVAVRVGQTVLVGEAKCTVYPTEPHEYRLYEDTLHGGASQAARKAQAVRDNPRALMEAAGWTDLDADALSVVPCVISNLPLGTGYPAGDAPVADEYILVRYLNDGGVAQYLIQGAEGPPQGGQFTRFYSSPEEAAANLAGYLAAPPQYEVLHQSVVVERQGLIYFAGERPAQYTLYRVAPRWPGMEGDGST